MIQPVAEGWRSGGVRAKLGQMGEEPETAAIAAATEKEEHQVPHGGAGRSHFTCK